MLKPYTAWITALIFLLNFETEAQPVISVSIKGDHSAKTNLIIFEAQVKNYTRKYGTLHLFLEDVNHQRQWKLRYPLLDGAASGQIALPDSFPAGVYALHFSLRRELVHIMGRVKDKKPPRQINYIAVAANQDMAATILPVDEYGYFEIPNLVFDDKATFIFSPVGKTKDNWLDVELETPVDSVFQPLATQTLFITIGTPEKGVDTTGYRFSGDSFIYPKSTLQDVTITGKAKKEAEKIVEQFQGGFFDKEGYLFDGLSTDEITTSISVLDYLTGRVPGLQIYNSKDSAGYSVLWRGFEPAYFIDGMETDLQGLLSVATSEIAAVKAIRPPFYGVSMGSAGGAIAIFTKRSTTGSRYGNHFRFVVYGYTSQEYTLH
ncbi:MAG: hypothetical protein MUF29_02215 [Chitinophagaceae bacterium]|nr:hypothetical protein [Chitinophagaceae bacterium]